MPLDQQHEIDRIREERGEMSFFDHISELRKHLLRAAMAIVVVAIIMFINIRFIFEKIIFGPRYESFPTYQAACKASNMLGLGEAMCLKPPKFSILPRELGEVLLQHLYVSLWLGVICSFPLIFWEFWKFIKPGLHEDEKNAVRGIVWICSLLFMGGICFGYFVIAPFSISFLAGYSMEGVEISPSLSSYVTYMTMFTLPTGIVFQMPVAGYFLAKIGLIGKQALKTYRRHAIVAILIVAAIITPPDVVSQLLVSIPLFILYEITIGVVGRVQAKRERALEKEESALGIKRLEE
jgi:sec-independent protein translocase protein TatC